MTSALASIAALAMSSVVQLLWRPTEMPLGTQRREPRYNLTKLMLFSDLRKLTIVDVGQKFAHL